MGESRTTGNIQKSKTPKPTHENLHENISTTMSSSFRASEHQRLLGERERERRRESRRETESVRERECRRATETLNTVSQEQEEGESSIFGPVRCGLIRSAVRPRSSPSLSMAAAMTSQQDSGFFEISIKSLLKSWSGSEQYRMRVRCSIGGGCHGKGEHICWQETQFQSADTVILPVCLCLHLSLHWPVSIPPKWEGVNPAAGIFIIIEVHWDLSPLREAASAVGDVFLFSQPYRHPTPPSVKVGLFSANQLPAEAVAGVAALFNVVFPDKDFYLSIAEEGRGEQRRREGGRRLRLLHHSLSGNLAPWHHPPHLYLRRVAASALFRCKMMAAVAENGWLLLRRGGSHTPVSHKVPFMEERKLTVARGNPSWMKKQQFDQSPNSRVSSNVYKGEAARSKGQHRLEERLIEIDGGAGSGLGFVEGAGGGSTDLSVCTGGINIAQCWTSSNSCLTFTLRRLIPRDRGECEQKAAFTESSKKATCSPTPRSIYPALCPFPQHGPYT
ncbi:hypothetical protein JZ751_023060 [Albula glossodonta]|uniref:Uncharacterized protein n=1 Tax=Albula glossodonta TaxID=121402 RepID=A0A8T2PHZ9_9TELE|nr:hypothetical protein JZ751_023060 [Albula glossodonta]